MLNEMFWDNSEHETEYMVRPSTGRTPMLRIIRGEAPPPAHQVSGLAALVTATTLTPTNSVPQQGAPTNTMTPAISAKSPEASSRKRRNLGGTC
ncbi:hypothetical protein AJ80_07737 [Polytolypa hystricis UAMH7299]|uniref:Uncharacterized protein n=1 Tax=Polytolypa hystricis (strain UAMH7299) TaxID=1447883 RepID=A0A2B7XIA5_POLH7|nr:hypothetical protein AJ80_07737 [Polytolypa hystricis UAMH7299]